MGTLKDPKGLEQLLNLRLKLLFQLGGAPAVRVCEGEFGIPRQHWRILATLVELGPLPVGAVARHTFIDTARISRGLAALRRMGLVERRNVVVDRVRSVEVAATAAGRAVYDKLFPRLAAINRRLCEVLSQDEADQLEALLERLTHHAAAIAEHADDPAKAQRRLGGAHRVWDRAGADARPASPFPRAPED
jgi:DNA-binding MarR family transcriptional regulator